MDKKLEKELRKASFYVMAGQLEAITGRTFLTVTEVSDSLKVSRPTAKKFMEKLIEEGKAIGHMHKRKLVIVVYFSQWTTKEVDSAHRAYDNLRWGLSQ